MNLIEKSLKKINKTLVPKSSFFGPEHIVLGVNNVCNLHCKMCDVGTQNLDTNFAQNLVGTSPLNMPIELCNDIIEQTATYYPKAKISFAFTEPLVYPHLEEALLTAKKHQLTTTLTTNALNLKRKAEIILNGQLTELNVSIDGPQDIHNEIRGNKKSFQKAIEGIQELKKHKNCPKISVICAITEWNIGHLEELVDELQAVEVDEIAFMHMQFNSEKAAELHNNSKWGAIYPATDSNIDQINFDNFDLPLLEKEIQNIEKKTIKSDIYFSPPLSGLAELERYYLEPEVQIGKHCSAVYTSIMIKSDASVIPAHGRCYNLNIGNLNNQNLSEIWKSQTLKKLRKDLNDAGGLFTGCSRCCSAF